MKATRICIAILITFIAAGCNKSSDSTNQPSQIDVSKQWFFDPSGLLLTGPGDNQWKSTTFSTAELSLFSSMDTANLAGTSNPSTVLESNGYNSIYPNPIRFSSGHGMHFEFPTGYNGQFVLKLVYVDSLMSPVFKMSVRLQSNAYPPPTTAGVSVLLLPSVPVGRHRLYYTLSAQNNPHFYKVWGNIQCNP